MQDCDASEPYERSEGARLQPWPLGADLAPSGDPDPDEVERLRDASLEAITTNGNPVLPRDEIARLKRERDRRARELLVNGDAEQAAADRALFADDEGSPAA